MYLHSCPVFYTKSSQYLLSVADLTGSQTLQELKKKLSRINGNISDSRWVGTGPVPPMHGSVAYDCYSYQFGVSAIGWC